MHMNFVYGKTHPNAKPCWLILVRDHATLERVHRWVSIKLFLSFGIDPHMVDENGYPRTLADEIRNPVRLGAKWLSSAFNLFYEHKCFCVNPVGGMLPLNKVEVLSETQGSDFPVGEPIAGETVYALRWPGRNHYYLKSTANRLFPFEKVHSEKEVESAVKKYAPGAALKFEKTNTPFVYQTVGD